MKTDDATAPEEQVHSEQREPESVEVEAGALEEFSDEQLPAPLRRALEEKGYNKLTSVQRSVVLENTDATDLRISSQTGSGKTVAIGLALGRQILAAGRRDEEEGPKRSPRVLILTPTRELAAQVKRELQWLFSDVPDAWLEVVTGGTSVGLERKQLSRGPRIVVGTPGRVLDHLENRGFSGEAIEQVVLDEADQMLDMGFRDELAGILDQLPARQRTHLVSATFSGEVLRIADQYQIAPTQVQGSALGKANDDIEHVAHLVGFRHRYDVLVNLLLRAHALSESGELGRTLVFTRTRADTLEVAERLQRDGIRAEPLSGDLAQAQRTRTLSAFRLGRVSTLVATDVAARGLDVQGVDLVIHYDPPGDPEAFTHRSGRTGRAGRKGTSVLLLPPQARGRLERLLKIAGVRPKWAPAPSADKIKKLYSKVKKRRLFAALDEDPPAEDLEYAKKLLEDQEPERVIAKLLAMVEIEPLCPPREISEHIAPEGRGPKQFGGKYRGDDRGRGRRSGGDSGGPGRGRSGGGRPPGARSGPRPPHGGSSYGGGGGGRGAGGRSGPRRPSGPRKRFG